jgi:hypothetical protein
MNTTQRKVKLSLYNPPPVYLKSISTTEIQMHFVATLRTRCGQNSVTELTVMSCHVQRSTCRPFGVFNQPQIRGCIFVSWSSSCLARLCTLSIKVIWKGFPWAYADLHTERVECFISVRRSNISGNLPVPEVRQSLEKVTNRNVGPLLERWHVPLRRPCTCIRVIVL